MTREVLMQAAVEALKNKIACELRLRLLAETNMCGLSYEGLVEIGLQHKAAFKEYDKARIDYDVALGALEVAS